MNLFCFAIICALMLAPWVQALVRAEGEHIYQRASGMWDTITKRWCEIRM